MEPELPGQDNSRKQKSKADWAKDIKHLLARKDRAPALAAVRHALEMFPRDPFFLSFYGYLVALIERRPKDGVKICEDAISSLRKSASDDTEFFYSVFYLNLGRAHMCGGKRKKALEAFHKGLRFAPGNHELLAEIEKMGKRQEPVIQFLSRSNPINKYLGKIRFRLQHSDINSKKR